MKASSESGECASLISTGSVSVFWAACLPAMSFVKFLGILRGPAKKPFLPLGRSEREEEDVRYAGTCEAPSRVYFALKRLTYYTRAYQPARKNQLPGRIPSVPDFSSSQICHEAYNPANEV